MSIKVYANSLIVVAYDMTIQLLILHVCRRYKLLKENELEGQEGLSSFPKWLQEIVANDDGVLGCENEVDLWNL